MVSKSIGATVKAELEQENPQLQNAEVLNRSEIGIATSSDFRMIFPAPEETNSCQNGLPDNAPKTAPANTILLVEDEKGLREITEFALVNSGFKVLQACDGIEAMEMFKQYKDEIICMLCDLKMPRMDGWGTISALRAMRQDLPVILTSGYDEKSVMAGEHPELPDFFLSKPYNLYKLVDTIDHTIAQKKMAQKAMAQNNGRLA